MMSEYEGRESKLNRSQGLARSRELSGVSDARLIWAVVINQILTVGEVLAGVASGSVSLLSDAAHNFNDANALLIAYIARKISKKGATERFTFGFRRAELLGAVINLTLLGVIGLYLAYEGIRRFFEPQDITGWLMAAASILALVVDLGTAILLWAMRKGSLNVRAAFVHNVVDAGGSVAVLVGAGAIMWLQWTWVDPLLTLILSAYILYQVYSMLPEAIRILMEGTPPGVDVQALVGRVEKLDGVESLHHLHLWELDEQNRALEAHVVISPGAAGRQGQVKRRIKGILLYDFEISHSTLEFEAMGEGCEGDQPAINIATDESEN